MQAWEDLQPCLREELAALEVVYVAGGSFLTFWSHSLRSAFNNHPGGATCACQQFNSAAEPDIQASCG